MPPFSHMEILMNPSILARYNRPVFFYFWSITIPWFCWFLAGYLSQLPQAADYAWLQGTLGMAGLLAPIAVAAWLFAADPLLLADLKARLFTRRGLNAPIVAFTLLFPPLSIIVAMAISLAFGYSADQFVISGSPSFSSALSLPRWSKNSPGTPTAPTPCCAASTSLPPPSSLRCSGARGICHSPPSRATTRRTSSPKAGSTA